ncbi:hypothetical protein Ct9H90mP29_22750 [bacterium]|nr:MAG: hypothetical protein Ct9H90mP29_22750 [bacterium]
MINTLLIQEQTIITNLLEFKLEWNVDDQSSLSTTLYGSKGRGGGTGPMNVRDTYMGDDG